MALSQFLHDEFERGAGGMAAGETTIAEELASWVRAGDLLAVRHVLIPACKGGDKAKSHESSDEESEDSATKPGGSIRISLRAVRQLGGTRSAERNLRELSPRWREGERRDSVARSMPLKARSRDEAGHK